MEGGREEGENFKEGEKGSEEQRGAERRQKKGEEQKVSTVSSKGPREEKKISSVLIGRFSISRPEANRDRTRTERHRHAAFLTTGHTLFSAAAARPSDRVEAAFFI